MSAFFSSSNQAGGLRARLILSCLFLLCLTLMFWSSSRYPSLDEKALMGGAIQLEDPLSFEAILPINPADPVYIRIVGTTVNWLETNRIGMTFGLLFAAGILTLLGYLKKRSMAGGFSNSVLGLFVGAPLGVCVNCAAPVARGLFAGGARVEMMLSAMIASPTLNVVVLTMLFSLFPLYLAITKLALSLLVILVLVPLIAKLLPLEQKQLQQHDAVVCPLPDTALNGTATVSLFSSLALFVKDYLYNLWFIVRKTLPLMILAGFLGAVMATLIPAELILDQPYKVLYLFPVALLGLFAPVPIGFDVVVSAVLLNSGLHIAYVATLLFTLGVFSVYSYFIVATTVSVRAASLLAACLLFIGIAAGLVSHQYNTWQTLRAMESLISNNDVSPDVQSATSNVAQLTSVASALVPASNPSHYDKAELTVSSVPFTRSNIPATQSNFTHNEAWHFGIDNPLEFSFKDMWPPFWEGRSVSTGDFDADGDLDVVIASSEQGLYLFANDGQGQFNRLSIPLDQFQELPVFNAVLVDIDNDGWLDLFITTYAQGNFWVKNNNGEFQFNTATAVANRDDAKLTMAVSFGDPDRDGDLDAALGNWTAGWYRRVPGDESKNRVVINDNGQFDGSNFVELNGIPGETLSVLFSDIDNNGTQDLLVANDFEIPDLFYLGDGAGALTAIQSNEGKIPHTTTTTMSFKSADLRNTGKSAIYAAQIAGRSSGVSERLNMRPIAQYCEGIEREQDKNLCQLNIDVKSWYRAGHSFDPAYASRCDALPGTHKAQCRGMLVKDLAIQKKNPELCNLIPKSQTQAFQYCQAHFLPVVTDQTIDLTVHHEQIKGRNVLLEQSTDGTFIDTAIEAGLDVGGWSWDVKIADFDNDQWQDVYIVNGTWVPNEVSPSNMYFKNMQGEKFEERAQSAGLVDYLITAAASKFDIDNDGDLDLLTIPVNGPAKLFVNNTNNDAGLSLSLRDHLGNRFGIGATVIARYGENLELMQSRELQLGGGFMSFDAPRLHFGLGTHKQVSQLEIRWVDGSSSTIKEPLLGGRHYTITRTKQN